MATSNIDQLIRQMEDLLKNSPNILTPKIDQKKPRQETLSQSRKQIPTTEFQSPIKGTYYNSGDYSPHARTDWRHKTHDGVDLRTSGGTAVFPMADGVVVSVGSGGKGGNTVTLLYPGNVKSYYAHLGTIAVHKGDQVFKNTVVGSVGDSGNAAGTAPHVHVQVWQNGQLQNPGKFFMVPKFTPMSKNEKMWLSDNAKHKAQAFSMKDHLSQKLWKSQRSQALASKIFEISKLADDYIGKSQ